jgi:hypothetical protein
MHMQRSIMTPILLLWTAALIAAPVAHAAPPDTRQAKVAAASANAVEGMKQEIAKIPLRPNLTVKDLLDRTRSEVTLVSTLQRARQIGGPRWLDDNTCQVHLEIDGRRVASALTSIAATHPQTSPISAEALQPLLADFESRTFGATGTSTGGATIEAFAAAQPPDAWAGVPETNRRQCLATARQNAVQRVLDSLRPVELAPGKTLGSELDNPQSPVRQQLVAYLQSAPVTGVQLREDRQAEVQIAPSPSDIADVLVSAQAGLTTTRLVAAAAPDEARTAALRDQVAQRMAAPVGTSAVATAAAADPNRAAPVVLPALPPEWANRQIDAAGTGVVPGFKLKSFRAAQNDVRSKLLAQVGALQLDTHGLTVADAAARDARLADAVQRALDRARPYKTVYQPDGSVTVYFILDLRDLWEELRAAS